MSKRDDDYQMSDEEEYEDEEEVVEEIENDDDDDDEEKSDDDDDDRSERPRRGRGGKRRGAGRPSGRGRKKIISENREKEIKKPGRKGRPPKSKIDEKLEKEVVEQKPVTATTPQSATTDSGKTGFFPLKKRFLIAAPKPETDSVPTLPSSSSLVNLNTSNIVATEVKVEPKTETKIETKVETKIEPKNENEDKNEDKKKGPGRPRGRPKKKEDIVEEVKTLKKENSASYSRNDSSGRMTERQQMLLIQKMFGRNSDDESGSENSDEESESEEESEEEIKSISVLEDEKPKKRGRKPKILKKSDEEKSEEEDKPKRRGRPPKKKGPGRPPKRDRDSGSEKSGSEDSSKEEVERRKIRRKLTRKSEPENWTECGKLRLRCKGEYIAGVTVYHRGSKFDMNIDDSLNISRKIGLDKLEHVLTSVFHVLYFEPASQDEKNKLKDIYSTLEKENMAGVVPFADRFLFFIPCKDSILIDLFGIKDSTKFIGALFKSIENDNPFEVQKQVGEVKKEEVSPTNLSMSPLPSKKLQSQQFQQQQQQQQQISPVATAPPVLPMQTQSTISSATSTVPTSTYNLNYPNNSNISSPLTSSRPPILYGNTPNYPSSVMPPSALLPQPPAPNYPPSTSNPSTIVAPPPPNYPPNVTLDTMKQQQPLPHGNNPPPPMYRSMVLSNSMSNSLPSTPATSTLDSQPGSNSSTPLSAQRPLLSNPYDNIQSLPPPHSSNNNVPNSTTSYQNYSNDYRKRERENKYYNTGGYSSMSNTMPSTYRNIGSGNTGYEKRPRDYHDERSQSTSPPSSLGDMPNTNNSGRNSMGSSSGNAGNTSGGNNNYYYHYREPSRHLWIGRFNSSVKLDYETLMKDFEVFGPVEGCNILKDQKCAFVNFVDIKDAIVAKDKLNGTPKYPKIYFQNSRYPSSSSGSGSSGGHYYNDSGSQRSNKYEYDNRSSKYDNYGSSGGGRHYYSSSGNQGSNYHSSSGNTGGSYYGGEKRYYSNSNNYYGNNSNYNSYNEDTSHSQSNQESNNNSSTSNSIPTESIHS